jgi:hypothetical protein
MIKISDSTGWSKKKTVIDEGIIVDFEDGSYIQTNKFAQKTFKLSDLSKTAWRHTQSTI